MSDKVFPETSFVVVVHNKHFIDAERRNTHRCLLAIALRAAFPDTPEFSVGDETVLEYDPDLSSPVLVTRHWHHDVPALVHGFDAGVIRAGDLPPEGVPVRLRRCSVRANHTC